MANQSEAIELLNADGTAKLQIKSEDGLTPMGRLKFVTGQVDIVTKLGDTVKIWVRRKIDKSVQYAFHRPRTSRPKHHGTSRFARFVRAQEFQKLLDEGTLTTIEGYVAQRRIRQLQA